MKGPLSKAAPFLFFSPSEMTAPTTITEMSPHIQMFPLKSFVCKSDLLVVQQLVLVPTTPAI